MPKAIVCIGPTSSVEGTVRISYTVSVIGPPHYSYAADYVVDTSMSVNANLIAWRSKVIAQAVEHGLTLLNSDVVTFGTPS